MGWAGLALVGAALGLAGCTAGRSALTTETPEIILGTTARYRTLDPADAYEIPAGNLLLVLGDRLYRYVPGTTQLQPQLATDWPRVSADGRTYTIPLRRDVLFHDGTPFNAEAMAFSLRRFMANGGRPAFLFKNVMASVEATGPYELTLRLKEPFGPFLALLAFSGATPVSPRAYTIGAGQFQPRTFVGTGPYRLVSFDAGTLRLATFDRYWGPRPANPGIRIQQFSNSVNLFNAFRSGAVEVAYQYLEPDHILRLKQEAPEKGWHMAAGPGTAINYLSLNVTQAPLNQPLVRRALALGISRSLIGERVYRNLVRPAFSMVPDSLPGFAPVFAVGDAAGRLALARNGLTQAGYGPHNPLTFDLWYRSNLPSHGPVVYTLKAQLERDLPVKVNLQGVESTTAYQNLEKGVYPSFLLDWYPDFLDADNYLEPFLSCSRGTPKTGCVEGSSLSFGSMYYSSRANALIAQERQTQDPKQRLQVFRQLQDKLLEDVPYIPLWQNQDFAFAQPHIRGLRLEPTQQFPLTSLSKSRPADSAHFGGGTEGFHAHTRSR
ncbi:MAG: peptide ABC transporter substrate-binding protein [Gloeomargaritaceae cyanobacterium C42_A2020_066]|nr:peptide ABC transporter substrate-binding protein [Gloeomargaritaceae cyanobacterium C42_A2020_066]